ncbi:unnamed protein product [Meloidogyne enterolobii]|uniref:Uncharacterized protein n=1 Tax=Meloidogyne enterolobii TaxID=390850 RepID=A0ACB0ZAX9_MELEN
MATSKFYLILFLIPFANLINCKNEKENGHDSEAIFKLQARARLATCHHGVGVLLYIGMGEISIATPPTGGPTELEVAKTQHLLQIATELEKSVNILKNSYDKDTEPPTQEIIHCIQLYVDAYQAAKSNISSVVVPKDNAQITSSIGAMMREIAPLMATIKK